MRRKKKSGAGKMIAAVIVVIILLCGIFAIMRSFALYTQVEKMYEQLKDSR